MTGFVVSLVTMMFAVAGLVFDGSRLVAARAELGDHAAGAARIAAQHVVDVRLGDERIDIDGGSAAAMHYLAAHNLDGTVRIDGLTVEVTVLRSIPLVLLSAIGVRERLLVVTREAELVER